MREILEIPVNTSMSQTVKKDMVLTIRNELNKIIKIGLLSTDEHHVIVLLELKDK